ASEAQALRDRSGRGAGEIGPQAGRGPGGGALVGDGADGGERHRDDGRAVVETDREMAGGGGDRAGGRRPVAEVMDGMNAGLHREDHEEEREGQHQRSPRAAASRQREQRSRGEAQQQRHGRYGGSRRPQAGGWELERHQRGRSDDEAAGMRVRQRGHEEAHQGERNQGECRPAHGRHCSTGTRPAQPWFRALKRRLCAGIKVRVRAMLTSALPTARLVPITASLAIHVVLVTAALVLVDATLPRESVFVLELTDLDSPSTPAATTAVAPAPTAPPAPVRRPPPKPKRTPPSSESAMPAQPAAPRVEPPPPALAVVPPAPAVAPLTPPVALAPSAPATPAP